MNSNFIHLACTELLKLPKKNTSQTQRCTSKISLPVFPRGFSTASALEGPMCFPVMLGVHTIFLFIFKVILIGLKLYIFRLVLIQVDGAAVMPFYLTVH